MSDDQSFAWVWWLGGIALVVAWLCIAGHVSSERGRSSWEGVIFTLFLGPLGILLAALMPEIERDEEWVPRK